jgi:hypothetical protein
MNIWLILGKTEQILITQNWHKKFDIYYEIEIILNTENTYYCSIKNLLPSCFLSKYLNIKICETVIVSVFLCCCETFSYCEERT